MARNNIPRRVAKDLIMFYLMMNEKMRVEAECGARWKNKNKREYQCFTSRSKLFEMMQKNITDESDLINGYGESIFKDIDDEDIEEQKLNVIRDTTPKIAADKEQLPINLGNISQNTYKNAFNELLTEQVLYIDSVTREIKINLKEQWQKKEVHPVLAIARRISVQPINYKNLYFFQIDDKYADAVMTWLNEELKEHNIMAYCTKLPNMLLIISEEDGEENIEVILRILRNRGFIL